MESTAADAEPTTMGTPDGPRGLVRVDGPTIYVTVAIAGVHITIAKRNLEHFDAQVGQQTARQHSHVAAATLCASSPLAFPPETTHAHPSTLRWCLGDLHPLVISHLASITHQHRTPTSLTRTTPSPAPPASCCGRPTGSCYACYAARTAPPTTRPPPPLPPPHHHQHQHQHHHRRRRRRRQQPAHLVAAASSSTWAVYWRGGACWTWVAARGWRGCVRRRRERTCCSRTWPRCAVARCGRTWHATSEGAGLERRAGVVGAAGVWRWWGERRARRAAPVVVPAAAAAGRGRGRCRWVVPAAVRR